MTRTLLASVLAAGFAASPIAALAVNPTIPEPHRPISGPGSIIYDRLYGGGPALPADGDTGGNDPSLSFTTTQTEDGTTVVMFGDGSMAFENPDGSGSYLQTDGTCFAWDSAGNIEFDVTTFQDL